MIFVVLIGLFLVVAASGLAYDAGVRVERRRISRAKTESALALTDSMFCSCGDEWGKWNRMEIDRKPVDARYPLTGGTIETRIQTRYCTSCGRADRRTVS